VVGEVGCSIGAVSGKEELEDRLLFLGGKLVSAGDDEVAGASTFEVGTGSGGAEAAAGDGPPPNRRGGGTWAGCVKSRRISYGPLGELLFFGALEGLG